MKIFPEPPKPPEPKNPERWEMIERFLTQPGMWVYCGRSTNYFTVTSIDPLAMSGGQPVRLEISGILMGANFSFSGTDLKLRIRQGGRTIFEDMAYVKSATPNNSGNRGSRYIGSKEFLESSIIKDEPKRFVDGVENEIYAGPLIFEMESGGGAIDIQMARGTEASSNDARLYYLLGGRVFAARLEE